MEGSLKRLFRHLCISIEDGQGWATSILKGQRRVLGNFPICVVVNQCNMLRVCFSPCDNNNVINVSPDVYAQLKLSAMPAVLQPTESVRWLMHVYFNKDETVSVSAVGSDWPAHRSSTPPVEEGELTGAADPRPRPKKRANVLTDVNEP